MIIKIYIRYEQGNYSVFNSEGDFRMVIGEDKSKVANIVRDNIQHFRILYSNILRDCPLVVYKAQQGKLEVRRRNTYRSKKY